MFKVNWNLTPEATRQDCLVGSIEIAAGGGTIAEDGVYVDSWLACLIKALNSQGDASIDIPEESVPLRVSVNGPDIALSFRNRRVTGTIESLRTALASSVREFLKATRTIPDGGYPNPLTPGFDDFVGEPQRVTRPVTRPTEWELYSNRGSHRGTFKQGTSAVHVLTGTLIAA